MVIHGHSEGFLGQAMHFRLVFSLYYQTPTLPFLSYVSILCKGTEIYKSLPRKMYPSNKLPSLAPYQ